MSQRRIVRTVRGVGSDKAELAGAAEEVVGEAGDYRPGGFGGEAAGGEMAKRLVFEVADRELQLGAPRCSRSTRCRSSSRLVMKAKWRQ